MTELHETDVDGVRCFWVDTGRPTLAALLIFRQGMADEPLAESGWLHLLEHLALHGRGGGALHVNGSVSMLHTTFDVHGPHAAVVEHLAAVTTWLSEPAFHEFERERDVLAAESALRGGSAQRAFGWRYGAVGPGTVSHDEPGVGRATPELLTERARRVFTRDNATLVLDGPPPADLRLVLPGGALLLPTPATVLEKTIPAAYCDDAGLVLSGVVTRSSAATVAQEILQRALRERLRETAGAAYAPWASYEPVDQDKALLLGVSDILPKLLPELADNILHLVKALRTEPVPEAWLREVVESRLQSVRDPYFATSLAGRAAHFHLNGQLPQSEEQILTELSGLRGDDVAASLAEFCGSLLLGIPSATRWRDQLPMLAQPHVWTRPEGRGFRSVDWPASNAELRVGPDRIEMSGGDKALAVAFDDVVGLFVFGDGGRYVLGRDGWGLHVLPSAWRRGSAAVVALDAAIPTGLHLPHPARDDVQHRRLPLMKRWRRGLSRLVGRPAAV